MNKALLFAAPLASGILLICAFPPFNFFLPSFLALVPLLFFIDKEKSDLRAALGAAFCGILFWAGLLYWITLFTRAGFIVLILIMSVNGLIFALVVRRLRKKLGIPLFFSVPFVWTAVEYLHAHGDLAFTWGQLAYSLTFYPRWLQMAAYTGPYGVTLWLVTLNVLVYEALKARTEGSRASRLSIAAVLLFLGPFLLGSARYHRYESASAGKSTLKCCYVQPGIPQDIKWSPEMQDSTFKILRELTIKEAPHHPLLVLWPEAAAPANLRFDEPYRKYVGDIARRLDCYLLTGAPEYRYNPEVKQYDSFNSAFFFSPEGQIIESYDKIHLVPVSERMPYEHVFTSLKEIDVGGSHFIPGTRHVVFSMGKIGFGALICFESSFPELSRSLVRNGANFLVNITNDAWFERTHAVYQHSAFLVLRAIEEDRAVVRAANTGISAFYDRLGRRHAATALYEVASATDTIHLADRLTFYCRYGDWPASLSWTVSLALLVLSFLPLRLRSKVGKL